MITLITERKPYKELKTQSLEITGKYYHNSMKPEERITIYDEAFRRLSPVMRKKALKNFILQRPKRMKRATIE